MSELPTIETAEARMSLRGVVDELTTAINKLVYRYRFLNNDPKFLRAWVRLLEINEACCKSRTLEGITEFEEELRKHHAALIGYLKKCEQELAPAVTSIDGVRFVVPDEILDFDTLLQSETEKVHQEETDEELQLCAAAETVVIGLNQVADFNPRYQEEIEDIILEFLDGITLQYLAPETGVKTVRYGTQIVNTYGLESILHWLSYNPEALAMVDLGNDSDALKKYLKLARTEAMKGAISDIRNAQDRQKFASAVSRHNETENREAEDNVIPLFRSQIEKTLEPSDPQSAPDEKW